jgi:cold shock CspA family protein
MGRSSESFNKKEKEKKRLKKQQEKAEKMEERKANAKKGKNLDDMLAYIDEDGNISSTPPDPRKRKEINHEDIQIGVPKQEPLSEEELIRTGVVNFFNDAKGFGFIKDSQTGESVFVHINQLTDRVKEGDKVIFEVQMGPKGPSAVNVKKG